MSTAKEFTEAVLGELRKAGWTRRGRAAWLRCSDAVVNVDLQKSNYDETVFVNVGIALHDIGHVDLPKYTDCHLQFRVERLVDGFPTSVARDAEELRNAVRAKEPELRALGELGELRSRSSQGRLSGGLVRKEARQLLALPSSS